MPTPNRPKSQTKYTPQYMGNSSFDEDFGVNTVEKLVYDPTDDTLNRAYPSVPLNLKPYDFASMAISPDTTETYTFKSGGSGGTTTNTVVVVYTDSTRADISTITKT